MPRQKKKLTYIQLHEHTVYWAIDQIENIRDTVDRVQYDDAMPKKHKDLMFAAMADQLNDLCDLLFPLNHDEKNAVDWARSFIANHRLPDEEIEH